MIFIYFSQFVIINFLFSHVSENSGNRNFGILLFWFIVLFCLFFSVETRHALSLRCSVQLLKFHIQTKSLNQPLNFLNNFICQFISVLHCGAFAINTNNWFGVRFSQMNPFVFKINFYSING